MTSCQASCGSLPSAIGAMPAFASTMSTGPSSATPSSNAAPGRLVADVGLAGDDPPVQRLDLLDRLGQVVLRGQRVRHGSICAQMSNAMMSAPSCASRTAWSGPGRALPR